MRTVTVPGAYQRREHEPVLVYLEEGAAALDHRLAEIIRLLLLRDTRLQEQLEHAERIKSDPANTMPGAAGKSWDVIS